MESAGLAPSCLRYSLSQCLCMVEVGAEGTTAPWSFKSSALAAFLFWAGSEQRENVVKITSWEIIRETRCQKLLRKQRGQGTEWSENLRSSQVSGCLSPSCPCWRPVRLALKYPAFPVGRRHFLPIQLTCCHVSGLAKGTQFSCVPVPASPPGCEF